MPDQELVKILNDLKRRIKPETTQRQLVELVRVRLATTASIIAYALALWPSLGDEDRLYYLQQIREQINTQVMTMEARTLYPKNGE
jgi:hypothetical protein